MCEIKIYNKCKKQSKIRNSYINIKANKIPNLKGGESKIEPYLIEVCEYCPYKAKCKTLKKIKKCEYLNDFKKLNKHEFTELEIAIITTISNAIIAIGTIIGLFIK